MESKTDKDEALDIFINEWHVERGSFLIALRAVLPHSEVSDRIRMRLTQDSGVLVETSGGLTSCICKVKLGKVPIVSEVPSIEFSAASARLILSAFKPPRDKEEREEWEKSFFVVRADGDKVTVINAFDESSDNGDSVSFTQFYPFDEFGRLCMSDLAKGMGNCMRNGINATGSSFITMPVRLERWVKTAKVFKTRLIMRTYDSYVGDMDGRFQGGWIVQVGNISEPGRGAIGMLVMEEFNADNVKNYASSLEDAVPLEAWVERA